MSEPDRPTAPLYTEPQSQNTDSSNSTSCCSNCVRPLLLMIIMLLLLLTLIIIIVWSIINPHNTDFRLTTISVSNITLNNSNFRATFNADFIVNNTNKKVELLVDHVKITVLFNHDTVSEKICEESVVVEKMSREKLQVHLGDDSVRRIKKGVFKDLSDALSKKLVDFQVKVGVRIRFEYRFWPSKERFVEVMCKNVSVEFRSNKGTGKLMSGGYCSVQ